uniref:Uncharacterized protein n=1 Tax=Arundo donax TaxID=35708 RepID=A0A0A9GJ71_ARUDO
MSCCCLFRSERLSLRSMCCCKKFPALSTSLPIQYVICSSLCLYIFRVRFQLHFMYIGVDMYVSCPCCRIQEVLEAGA